MPSYVIVGASRGLGYEWLVQLSKDPKNTVIGLARTAAPVEKKIAADKIKNVTLIEADMIDTPALEAAAVQVSKITNGTLDYLIVNGAYMDSTTSKLQPFDFHGKEDLLRKDMIASLDVNVIGVMKSINAFLELIQKGSVKKIIAISTGMADASMVLESQTPAAVTYSAIKAALNIVIVKYAIEFKKDGIIFLALSPGLVNTRTEPPSEADIKEFTVMLAAFRRTYPGFEGPITPAESVVAQKRVIEALTIEQSGEFLSHHGNKAWL